MGGEISLDKYCTAALPIEKNHKVDANGTETNELLHEDAQKRFKDDVSSPKTTGNHTLINTEKRRSSSDSKSTKKKSKYSMVNPSDDDEFDDGEHVDTLRPPLTSNRSKTTPRSKSSSKHSLKHKKKKDKGIRSRSKTRDKYNPYNQYSPSRNRRNTDPARSPSPASPRITPTLSMGSRPSVTILIPNNETTEPPKLSLLSSMSPKTSKSSTSSIGSLRKYHNQQYQQSMTPTAYGTSKRHSYHYQHHRHVSKSRRGHRIGSKSRSRADTHHSLHEELEEYEIQSRQDKHEKDILKAEIMKLRLELAKYQQVTHNMNQSYQHQHQHSMHQNMVHSYRNPHAKHKSAASGPAFTFPGQPKAELVPKFTDHDITEFDGTGTERTHSKKGGNNSSYPPTELADDCDNELAVNGLPITPTKSSPSHSRSNSNHSSKIEVTPQSVLSPLSPLSENMQNIILAFPATFPEVDGNPNGNGTNK